MLLKCIELAYCTLTYTEEDLGEEVYSRTFWNLMESPLSTRLMHMVDDALAWALVLDGCCQFVCSCYSSPYPRNRARLQPLCLDNLQCVELIYPELTAQFHDDLRPLPNLIEKLVQKIKTLGVWLQPLHPSHLQCIQQAYFELDAQF